MRSRSAALATTARLLPCAAAAAAVLVLAPAGCSRAPAEPQPAPEAGEPPAAVLPLAWTAPAAWTALRTADRGEERATYRVPAAGDDKEPAELQVTALGDGPRAKGSTDPAEVQFERWFSEFDGKLGPSARREQIEVGQISVRLVEVLGTYRMSVGPALGARGRHAVQIVKKGWRLLGAAAVTPDRGNWYFRLVGPDDTVQAARSAFVRLLESLR